MNNIAHPPVPPAYAGPAEGRWTATHVVLETIAHYSQNPRERRAVVPDPPTLNRCVYRRPAGEGGPAANCALGRYLQPDCADEVWDCGGGVDALVMDYAPLPELLRPEVAHLPALFWSALQDLHDRAECWEPEGGMTPRGLTAAATLIRWANAIDDGETLWTL